MNKIYYTVGRAKEKMFIWKKVLISATIAQAAKTITRPTSAAVIWLLAPSVADLSPPEAIQRIPPIIKIKKNITAATTIAPLIKPETMSGRVSEPKVAKLDVESGCKLICAK